VRAMAAHSRQTAGSVWRLERALSELERTRLLRRSAVRQAEATRARVETSHRALLDGRVAPKGKQSSA
jgi:hypothetical protein